jgi:hypothetical protein
MQRHRLLSREDGVFPRRQDRQLGIRMGFTNRDRGGEGIREG